MKGFESWWVYPSKLNHNSNHWLWFLLNKWFNFLQFKHFQLSSSIAFKDEQIATCSLKSGNVVLKRRWGLSVSCLQASTALCWSNPQMSILNCCPLDIWDFNTPPALQHATSNRALFNEICFRQQRRQSGSCVFTMCLTSTTVQTFHVPSVLHAWMLNFFKWPVFHSVAHAAGVSCVPIPWAEHRGQPRAVLQLFKSSSPI